MKTLILFFLVCVVTPTMAQNDAAWSDQNVRLQVFLDKKNFGPGKIDGLEGKFTQQALQEYKKAHDVDLNKDSEQLQDIDPLYVQYEITDDDKKHIGDVPDKPEEQAKKEEMPYKKHSELVAERYHVDHDFLSKLNPDKDMDKLKPGDVLKVPNVEPFRIEDLKEGDSPEKKDEFSDRKIVINTKEKLLKVVENDKVVAVFPITPGSEQLPAPQGEWKLKSITYLPTFRYDKKMLKEGERSEDYHIIPPGPNNPVGIVWMALNKKGIGIHGSDKPDTIGRSASHGCIRLANWDAMKLSKMVTPGIKVEID